MNLGDRIWNGVKFLLTAVLVFVSAVCVFGAVVSGHIADPSLFGIVGFFLFLAALPWVPMEKPSRALALIAILTSIGIFVFANLVLNGDIQFPEDCRTYRTDRAKLGCELFNQVYLFGGAKTVALIFISVGLLLLFGALRYLVQSRRTQQRAPGDSQKPRT